MKAKTTINAKKSALKELSKNSAKNKITDKTTFTLILFPNQLFNKQKLDLILQKYNIQQIYFIEHPLYFGYFHNTKYIAKNINSKYKFNKIKIIYHLATSLYYNEEVLSQCGIKDINYINIADYNNLPNFKNNYQHQLIFFDTLNKELNNEIQTKYKQNLMLDNHNILTPTNSFKKYFEKHKNKKQNHSAFYKWQRQRLNILTSETKAYDIQQKMPTNEHKNIPALTDNINKKYLEEAYKLFNQIENRLSYANYHDDAEILFPITHKDAELTFRNFLKNKLAKFGKYQDSSWS